MNTSAHSHRSHVFITNNSMDKLWSIDYKYINLLCTYCVTRSVACLRLVFTIELKSKFCIDSLHQRTTGMWPVIVVPSVQVLNKKNGFTVSCLRSQLGHRPFIDHYLDLSVSRSVQSVFHSQSHLGNSDEGGDAKTFDVLHRTRLQFSSAAIPYSLKLGLQSL